MGNLSTQGIILAKIESTYGSDSSPAATNAIVASNIAFKLTGEKVARNATSGSMSPWAHQIGSRSAEVSFDVDLRGYGSAYSASNLPEVSPLLRACGFAETVDVTGGSEKVDYDPVSDAFESCTIYVYDAEILYKLSGCRGDVSFLAESGKLGSAKFSFQALYADPVDQSAITPVYQDPSVMPPVFLSAGMTIGGYSAVASKLELKVGSTLAKRVNANSTDGYSEIFINGRATSGSVDPEAVALSTKDFFGEWKAGTPQAIEATLGSTQYNRMTFSVPKAQYDSVDPGDRDGIRTFVLPFVCTRDSGDDELKITFD